MFLKHCENFKARLECDMCIRDPVSENEIYRKRCGCHLRKVECIWDSHEINGQSWKGGKSSPPFAPSLTASERKQEPGVWVFASVHITYAGAR